MKIMNKNGVTLIELIIVVSVIGILVVSLGFSFQGWIGKYRVESQIKEMYVDLMNAKANAMQRNRMYFIMLTTKSYTIYEDTFDATYGATYIDGDGVLQTASDRRVLLKDLNPGEGITWSDITDARIGFTKKGLSNDTKTICSNKDVDADYDCLGISASQINAGKLTTRISSGGACNATNCVAK